jgi:hypothetical protein
MERCDLGRQASVHTTDRKDVGYSTRRIDASTLMFEDLRELASMRACAIDSTHTTTALLDTKSAFSFGRTFDSSSGGFLHSPTAIWNPAAGAGAAVAPGPPGTMESVYSLGVFDERHGSLDPGYAACVSEDVRHVCWSHVTTR